MNSFDRYTAEMEKFERGKLFRLKYVRFIKLLNEEHVGPFHFKRAQSKYFEECLDIRSSEVRALVRHARRSGVPVASDENGYYIAKSFKELRGTIKHLEERGNSISFTLSRLRRSFEGETQTALFG